MSAEARQIVGIDVGGSSIKGLVVDPVGGAVRGEVMRVRAPAGFEVVAVLDAIADVANELGPELAVGVGFPSVVRDGVLGTDATSHQYPGWKGLAIENELAVRLGRTVAVGNDADVAGEAEMRLGAAKGRDGTVLVLTFGTGIGSAVFRDGVLVPNVELGRVYLRGQEGVAEDHSAGRVKHEQGLDWAGWAARLRDYLAHIERVMAPDLVVIGGAISSEAAEFLPLLDLECEVVAAEFGNDAGAIGAAMLASHAERP